METASAHPPVIDTSAAFRRIGGFAFPYETLVAGSGVVLAGLGRNGSLRIFFGPGRRVRLADDTEWRIKATTSGKHIVPIITSALGAVAVSGPLHAKRSYGINGKDYGYTLLPVTRSRLRRPGQWVMRRHETQIATIDEHPRVIRAAEPIPLSAVLLAFTLMKHGIPGEADLMPRRG